MAIYDEISEKNKQLHAEAKAAVEKLIAFRLSTQGKPVLEWMQEDAIDLETSEVLKWLHLNLEPSY